MNDIDLKRQALVKAYDGPTWPERVKKMSDSQVLAVYFRLKQAGGRL